MQAFNRIHIIHFFRMLFPPLIFFHHFSIFPSPGDARRGNSGLCFTGCGAVSRPSMVFFHQTFTCFLHSVLFPFFICFLYVVFSCSMRGPIFHFVFLSIFLVFGFIASIFFSAASFSCCFCFFHYFCVCPCDVFLLFFYSFIGLFPPYLLLFSLHSLGVK